MKIIIEVHSKLYYYYQTVFRANRRTPVVHVSIRFILIIFYISHVEFYMWVSNHM